MTTTNLARLQDLCRIGAPGATDGTIRLMIFEKMKDFFARTNAWLLEVPVYVVPQASDYQIETGQNVVVNRLMSLARPLSPLPPDGQWPPIYAPMCPPQYLTVSGGVASTESQNPMFRTWRAGALLNAGSKCPILRLDYNPQADEMWVATLAVNVCDPLDSEGFVCPPDWIMEKWLKYISSGVLCELMLQPAKPYSSLPGSQYHGRKFNEGVGLARTEVKNMFIYGAQHWQFPGGWNSRMGLRRGFG